MMGSVSQDLVEGIAKIGDRLLTWLDLDRVVGKGGDDPSEAERQVG
jgi:chemotaxis signal transduction protein